MEISAIIIGKDNSETILDTLFSVQPFCKQIVYVDTGSEDNTPTLMTQNNAEVYFHKWNDDFSEARNFAISMARQDWILSIDTDEILSEVNLEDYSHLFEDPKIGGINVILKNYINPDDFSQFTTHRFTRIFRNNPAFKFSGRVHEQIRNSIENAGFEIIDTDITIEHFGYLDSSPEKQERNHKLLESDLQENSQDVFLKYHLANTEFSMNNLQDAFKLYSEIIDSNQLTNTQNDLCKLRLAQIHLSRNEFNLAESYLTNVMENSDYDGFRLFILAAIKMNQQKFEEARELYKNPILLDSSMVDKSAIETAEQIFKHIL